MGYGDLSILLHHVFFKLLWKMSLLADPHRIGGTLAGITGNKRITTVAKDGARFDAQA